MSMPLESVILVEGVVRARKQKAKDVASVRCLVTRTGFRLTEGIR